MLFASSINSYKTEKNYVGWIKSYIVFHNKQHPKEIG